MAKLLPFSFIRHCRSSLFLRSFTPTLISGSSLSSVPISSLFLSPQSPIGLCHISTGPIAPKISLMDTGCDGDHWLIVMDPPSGDPSSPDVLRDEIIQSYIKTLSKVLNNSETAARSSIYSVSTKHYFAFRARISKEIAFSLHGMSGVMQVLPDAYVDLKNKRYGGEPFIDGQAVPYDPKYHEEWAHKNKIAKERSVELRRQILEKTTHHSSADDLKDK